jgi:exosortase K
MKQKMIWGAQLMLVVLCALGLKFYYSTATVNELRWILAPTTSLVELLSGRSFEFESFSGYMSSDRRFVIAVSCAGVNFLITSFLMLGLRALWRRRFENVGWKFLAVAAALAYVSTVIANTVRICIALEIQRRSIEVSGLSENQLHRLEGIVVYFGFLLILFVLSERSESAKPKTLLLFPLAVYYVTTLGIPLLNGSYHQGSPFWEHFLFVLVLPLIFFVPFVLFCGYAYRRTMRVQNSA